MYNPGAGGGSLDAKIWELLRRHPGFRRCAERLVAIANRDPGVRDGFKVLNRFLSRIDYHNPLAGYVLRWLFKPQRIQFSYPRQPHDFFRDWTNKDWQESGFPYFTDEQLDELETLLTTESDGSDYPGPLQLREGPFNLDTSWPDTPELFQFLFRWIWSDYGFGGHSEFHSDVRVHFNPGPVQLKVDWRFLDRDSVTLSPETVRRLRDLKTFIEYHHLYALPRVLYPQLAREVIKKGFSDFLDELLNVQGQMIATNKLPELFGSKGAWEVFAFCYPEIDYDYIHKPMNTDLLFPFQRTGSGDALLRLIEQKQATGDWSKSSDHSVHVERHYSRLESLMKLIFPKFDFAEMLKLELPDASESAVHLLAEAARSASRYKLHCLHWPKGTQTSRLD